MTDPAHVHADRYARQTRLVEIGVRGQQRLHASHAVIVGCGALGCTSADLLVRAGVGRVTIIDRDLVERSNLQRQMLFSEPDAAAGVPKAQAAQAYLRAVNSEIEIVGVVADLRAGNAERLMGLSAQAPGSTTTVLIDGTDNFETRYLLNDISVKHRLPLVYGGVLGTGGMHATFLPGGPCLRCVFEDPPAPGTQPTCESAGVLGPAAAAVAAMQAASALRLCVTGAASGDLFELNAWLGTQRCVSMGPPRPECPCCGERRFSFLDATGEADAEVVCGQNSVQVWPGGGRTLDLSALALRLAGVGRVRLSDYVLTFEPPQEPPVELKVFADARVIVRGTSKPDVARQVYARYIGL